MAYRVEIAGSLASGKTTLCDGLKSHFATAVYENFEGNPYIALAAENPDQFGLKCQQWFVQNKINMLTRASCGSQTIISDFSLVTDRAYVDYYLKDRPDWIAALNHQLDEGVAIIGQPDAIIFLTCPDEEQLNRIQERGRDFEQSISPDFISSINTLVSDKIAAALAGGLRVIAVDTTIWDIRNELTVAQIMTSISKLAGAQIFPAP